MKEIERLRGKGGRLKMGDHASPSELEHPQIRPAERYDGKVYEAG